MQCSRIRSTLAIIIRMAGIRERARVETTAEIVRLARLQVEQDGAASLSLRAIARSLGMVSSAVYRYFASRDELLTQLIVDSYERLGAAVELADASVPVADFRGRWRAAANSFRDWAIENPSEYALLFGTPVPGYAAPQDTIGPASRYTATLMGLLVDIESATGVREGAVPLQLQHDFARLRAFFPAPASDVLMMYGMTSWAGMMGAITLELFGHLRNVIDTPGALFDALVDQYADLIIPQPKPIHKAVKASGRSRRK